MKNIINKTITPLSLAVLLGTGVISNESQADTDMGLFLSNNYGEALAFNSGVRGKPPYIRSKMNRQRMKNQRHNLNLRSVEMSALEINQDSVVEIPSQIKRKSTRGRHPDRAKSHGYR